MSKFILAAVMLFLTGTTANAEMTVAGYLKDQGKGASRHAIVLLWLGGVETGFEWANTDYVYKGVKPMFCQPDKLALTQDQVVSVLDNYLKTATIQTDTPIGLALLLAMKEAFPCN